MGAPSGYTPRTAQLVPSRSLAQSRGQGQMGSSDGRDDSWGAGLATVLAALALLALSGIYLGLRLTAPSDGAAIRNGPAGWQAEGLVVTPLEARLGGLHEEDVVVA